MLPVRVNAISSSTCSLSEASKLLNRFVTSDPSSDSYAKSYVKTVAVALDECLSRREGALIATADRRGGKERTQRHSIGSPAAELGGRNLLEISGSCGLRKCGKWNHATEFLDVSPRGRSSPDSLLKKREHAVSNVTRPDNSGMHLDHARDDLRSGAPETASKKCKKKRRHSTIDDTAHPMVHSEERMAVAFEDSQDKRSERKRRKKERKDTASDPSTVLSFAENVTGVATMNSSDPQLPRGYQYFASEKEKRRKHRKHRDSGTQTLSE